MENKLLDGQIYRITEYRGQFRIQFLEEKNWWNDCTLPTLAEAEERIASYNRATAKRTHLTGYAARMLPVFKNAEELPEEAVYYAKTSTAPTRNGIDYLRIFDADFNEIGKAHYSSKAVNSLIYVSDESDYNDYHFRKLVYHLKERNNKGFWLCESISN